MTEIVEYTKLGTTGMDVSRICLGAMSYGVPNRGGHPWSLDYDDALPFFRQAVEGGINFFDTADVYSDGTSEEITGRALRELADRDEVVIATKVFMPLKKGPNRGGLSRKAIMQGIDNSLSRLGVDHVDLYQIHRWDYETPIEETLEALHDVVKAGKARYLGASSMWSWQFAQALALQEHHGWSRFVTMQNHYNLLYREEEREMLPLCADAGIGSIPWSPLARGRLTRDWDTSTARAETDEFGKSLYRDTDRAIVDAVAEIADKRGVTRAQVALSWVANRPAVSAPIVGATKERHLTEALSALDVELDDDETAALEEHYVTREPVGHR